MSAALTKLYISFFSKYFYTTRSVIEVFFAFISIGRTHETVKYEKYNEYERRKKINVEKAARHTYTTNSHTQLHIQMNWT